MDSKSYIDLCRIIKDFYVPEDDSLKRPKVFGMTASPVDAREDIVKAAKYGVYRYDLVGTPG